MMPSPPPMRQGWDEPNPSPRRRRAGPRPLLGERVSGAVGLSAANAARCTACHGVLDIPTFRREHRIAHEARAPQPADCGGAVRIIPMRYGVGRWALDAT